MFQAKIKFNEITPGRITLKNGINVESSLHPHPEGAIGYRIEIGNNVISYITDIEHPIGKPLDKVINLARNSDVLIHEAHFTPEDLPNYKGWGHSSWEEAVKVAQRSNSKQLSLYHYCPTYEDTIVEKIGTNARKVFTNTFLAKENLTINISDNK